MTCVIDSNTIGCIASVASVDWGAAVQVMAAIGIGSGFVIDLSLTARNKASNGFVSPEAGYKPLFNNPTSPTFQPGADGGAPGVLLGLFPDSR